MKLRLTIIAFLTLNISSTLETTLRLAVAAALAFIASGVGVHCGPSIYYIDYKSGLHAPAGIVLGCLKRTIVVRYGHHAPVGRGTVGLPPPTCFPALRCGCKGRETVFDPEPAAFETWACAVDWCKWFAVTKPSAVLISLTC